MSADLDLGSVEEPAHSEYAPSSSSGWAHCADYLNANRGLPDTAGKDAAEGTVFHGFIEEYVRTRSLPSYRIGATEKVEAGGNEYEVTVDADMVGYARRCFDWVKQIPGDVFVETKVDFSDLMPIPNQKGTCDLAICQSHRLTVRDWKYGTGVQVFVKDEDYDPADPDRHEHLNSQVLLYAYGFFREFDDLYDFQTIDIGIGQPRLDHWDTIVISRDELLAFAAWIKGRAYETVKPNPPRTPSAKACRWCKVRGCPAAMAQNLRMVSGRFTNLDEPVSGQEMAEVGSNLVAEPVAPDPRRLTTQELVNAYRYRKMMENFFKRVEDELEFRALAGQEVPGHKLVLGRKNQEWLLPPDEMEDALRLLGLRYLDIWDFAIRSPNQIVERVKLLHGLSKSEAAKMVAHLINRPVGRPTLVSESDSRARADSVVLGKFPAYDAVDNSDI